MTDSQSGGCRAQGALDNFLAEMAAKLDRENRSAEYVFAFNVNLKSAMAEYALRETKIA